MRFLVKAKRITNNSFLGFLAPLQSDSEAPPIKIRSQFQPLNIRWPCYLNAQEVIVFQFLA